MQEKSLVWVTIDNIAQDWRVKIFEMDAELMSAPSGWF